MRTIRKHTNKLSLKECLEILVDRVRINEEREQAERHEAIENRIVADLGGYEDKMLNFRDVCNLLKSKYGLVYRGGDDERECHVFTNGTDTVHLFPKIYYPKQGMMRLRNLYVSLK